MPQRPWRSARALLLTLAALVAFAANSILTRAALAHSDIDPATFTAIRIASGALTLLAVVALRGSHSSGRGSWVSAWALFGYAILFSLAYRSLTAATGALLLFGAVQVTMTGVAQLRGEVLRAAQWLGLALALAGLVALLWPGLAAPPPVGAACMLGAGVAWGIYTLRGRTSGDPIAANATHFLFAAAPAGMLLALVLFAGRASWDPAGALLAVASGAVASGLGYAVWYAALRSIKTHTAAVAQLFVPVLTALGGVVLLAEPLTPRLALAGAVVLAGIGLVVHGGRPRVAPAGRR
jgi:drug/metabolite transporter (DMT)-like permease